MRYEYCVVKVPLCFHDSARGLVLNVVIVARDVNYVRANGGNTKTTTRATKR